MPQFERRLYDPAEDAQGLDDDSLEAEGSRLPLLIIIALVVLMSFAGVVWLAYTQGVQRGREDAPRIIASQQENRSGSEAKNPYSDLQIYQRGKSAESAKDLSTSAPRTKTVEATPAEAMTKPAPQAILPPPVLNPVAKAPAKPPTAAQANVLKPQVSNPALKSTSSSTPATPEAIKAPPRQATGTPQAIAPALTPGVEALSITPPASTPEQQTAASVAGNAAPTQEAAAAQDFVLQIGSYTSEAEANASWETYKAGHPSVAGYAPDIQKADLGRRGTWYRLRVGPFASLQDAAAACAKLKAQGASCLPAKR